MENSLRRSLRGGGLVLGGEDVARGPRNGGSEGGEGLDEHGGLDSPTWRNKSANRSENSDEERDAHVETSSDVGAGKGLRDTVLERRERVSQRARNFFPFRSPFARTQAECWTHLGTEVHESGHLVLSELDLLSSPGGERNLKKGGFRSAALPASYARRQAYIGDFVGGHG